MPGPPPQALPTSSADLRAITVALARQMLASVGAGWQAFARINNLFDRRYASGGALAENPFVGGSFQANSDHWRRESFVAPGAPRAAWVGVRYSFGGR